jgi:hypothetical protein
MKPCEGCIQIAADLAETESRLARALQALERIQRALSSRALTRRVERATPAELRTRR